MIASWIVFPALLAALAVGCGFAIERLGRLRLPFLLVLPAGLAGIVVLAQLFTIADATAELATPAVLAMAVGGWALALRRPPPAGGERADGSDWPAAAAALGVFAVFAAPVVLSGDATFAGYIKLDDTATWMALTDRVMEHGRSLEGLAPSTYEATLDFNLDEGYPVGAFLPLGVGAALTGVDVAWLIQPYLAVLAAATALALAALVRPLIRSTALHATVVFLAAQPALLYGYALWGGVKELAAAALIATIAALFAGALERGGSRAMFAAAVAVAALVAVLSPAGGVVWAAPLLALAGLYALRALGWRGVLARLAALAGLAALLAAPTLQAGLTPPTSAPLTAGEAQGNLVEPLEPLQAVGIWPAGDFRFSPDALEVAYVLIAVAIGCAVVALVVSRRGPARALLAYVLGTASAATVLYAFGSPWVDGKTLAIASPAILVAALAGAAALARGGPAAPSGVAALRRASGVAALAALAVGVVWSNILAYGEVNLAPRAQLEELERIGELFPGSGPTLMTEYQPYGARHFLRDADPEAASELRRRRVPLEEGGLLEKGEWADTDALAWRGLRPYRTLVLRRSPSQSRPPSRYGLAWEGEWYEVWRARPAPPAVLDRLGLGDGVLPVARASCAGVGRLAAAAGRSGRVAYVRGPDAVRVRLARSGLPPEWERADGAVHPVDGGRVEAVTRLPSGGRWGLWLRGSVRGELRVEIDGRAVAEVRHVLNNEGQYVPLGEVALARGRHEVAVVYGEADLHPGSAGAALAAGPLVLERVAPRARRLRAVGAQQATGLCGRRIDWLEALGSG